MKSHHLFLLLLFFLVSCAPSTPVPTATPAPTSTATLTPIPTATQTATSTPEAWVAIANEYGMPEEMVRQLEGVNVGFEEDLPNVVSSVLVVNEEASAHMFFRDEHGNWVETDRYEASNNIEDTTRIEIPEEDLFDGTYLAYLNYLASQEEIDWDNIEYVKPQMHSIGMTNVGTRVAGYNGDELSSLSSGKKIGIIRDIHFGYTIAACSASGVGDCYQSGEDFIFYIKPVLNLNPDEQKASPAITGQVQYCSIEESLEAADEYTVDNFETWKSFGFFTPIVFDVEDVSGYAHALIQRSIEEMYKIELENMSEEELAAINAMSDEDREEFKLELREKLIEDYMSGNVDVFNKPGVILGNTTVFAFGS